MIEAKQGENNLRRQVHKLFVCGLETIINQSPVVNTTSRQLRQAKQLKRLTVEISKRQAYLIVGSRSSKYRTFFPLDLKEQDFSWTLDPGPALSHTLSRRHQLVPHLQLGLHLHSHLDLHCHPPLDCLPLHH